MSRRGPTRARLRGALTPEEWRRAVALAVAIVAMHVIGLALLLALVVPHSVKVGTGGFGLGLGATAYVLGLRHAFDADHIAAIDNTTRKLMADGQRPLSVGFFFSLGHSTVVFGLALLLGLGVRGLGGAVGHDNSTLHAATGVIGPAVSGAFLFLIGLLNVGVLIGSVRVFRRMRAGEFDEHELERQLDSRGLLNRFYARATRAISKPLHMYPLGVLFGLGFDTATEVALLLLAAGVAASSLPFYAVMSLPILFAAGMSLLDTADGAFMNFAYGWAFSKPVRQALLQHHHHRSLGGRGAVDRDDRTGERPGRPPGPGPGPLGDPHRRRSQLRRIPRRRDLCPRLGDRRCHLAPRSPR